jgi:hypothetical protein
MKILTKLIIMTPENIPDSYIKDEEEARKMAEAENIERDKEKKKNSASQEFRNDLTKEILKAPKEERRQILDKAKTKPEYWEAREERLRKVEKEEAIDNGLGIFIKRKVLFHGSNISGIQNFKPADETTIGQGVYLTSQAEAAIRYAHGHSLRHENKTPPIIYEVSIENLKLLDLRDDKNVDAILQGFREILLKEKKKPGLKWYEENAFSDAIEAIDTKRYYRLGLREVTWNFQNIFADYCKFLGYDGLIYIEGGNAPFTGDHDTYLIFDPSKIKVIEEHKLDLPKGETNN